MLQLLTDVVPDQNEHDSGNQLILFMKPVGH